MTHLPPGLYESLVTAEMAQHIERLPAALRAQLETVEAAEMPAVLSRYVHATMMRAVSAVSGEGTERLHNQVALTNQVLSLLGDLTSEKVVAPGDLLPAEATQLMAVYPQRTPADAQPPRPGIPLSSSDLLVNAPRDLRIGSEIKKELETADRVDLLCAFLLWTGLRVIREPLEQFLARGGKLRVITSCYIGATERQVLDELVAMGRRAVGTHHLTAVDSASGLGSVEVKVSYDVHTTRLHAKAWLFHRESGYSTAYIGSSNLSQQALLDGLEWNIRVSNVDARHILEKFRAMFDSYWQSSDFETYIPERDSARFDQAIAQQRGLGADDETDDLRLVSLDLRPFPYQQEILERLQVEREVHGRFKNLVVAATGTGKTIPTAPRSPLLRFAVLGRSRRPPRLRSSTYCFEYACGARLCGLPTSSRIRSPRNEAIRRRSVVAAFDYARLRQQWGHGGARLLFVAHRDHILKQSLNRFRLVLGDVSFGSLYTGGRVREGERNLFASIQGLTATGIDALDPDAFDVLVVDEFHHAAAPTYRRLLDHLRPRVLLGLTATPERTDGQSVLEWFDGRIAAELRLWHALDRQLLVPFQYFGVKDEVALDQLRWTRGHYDLDALDQVYTGNHERVRLVLRALQRHILHIGGMRAIGFCVSVEHARFMAEQFKKHGIPADVVTGDVTGAERDAAIAALRARRVNVLFTVDVLGEGVDIPEVDTILMLRPTESATVFQQQLGRGLRLAPGKSCLTVLDFIGMANKSFRFDLRYASLVPGGRAEIRKMVENDFPYLPSGCTIRLEREAQQVILENLRTALGQGLPRLVQELKAIGPQVGLADFLQRTELEVEDVYRSSSAPSWTLLRRKAGFTEAPKGWVFGDVDGGTVEPQTGDAARASGQTDDTKMLSALRKLLALDDVERIHLYRDVLQGKDVAWTERTRRMWTMLHLAIFAGEAKRPSFEEGLQRIANTHSVRRELIELLDVLEDRLNHAAIPLNVRGLEQVPLKVHGTYGLDEILGAFAYMTADTGSRIREGVWFDKTSGHDVFFITLNKTEKKYSPTTMYRDYVISPTLFHWESQSTTREASPAGTRYQGHGTASGTHALLFVRESPNGPVGGAAPYRFLGPADYVSHEGERPMAIVWRMHHAMPAAVVEVGRAVA